MWIFRVTNNNIIDTNDTRNGIKEERMEDIYSTNVYNVDNIDESYDIVISLLKLKKDEDKKDDILDEIY